MMRRWILWCLFFAALAPASLAQNGEWTQLFNGKDLSGWKHVGPGGETVETTG